MNAPQAISVVETYCLSHGYPLEWALENGSFVGIESPRIPIGRRNDRSKKVEYVTMTLVNTLSHTYPDCDLVRTRLIYEDRHKTHFEESAREMAVPQKDMQRFSQAKKTGCGAYWGSKPQFLIAMEASRTDPAVSVLMFEAESNLLTLTYKMDKPLPYENIGDEAALVPMAIGGASSYNAKNLVGWVWAGRRMYMVPDRDDPLNRDGLKDSVRRAWVAGAEFYATKGADVFLCYIHKTRVGQADTSGKMGLDDFILAGGTLEELLETASRPHEGEAGDCADPVKALIHKYAYDAKNCAFVHRQDPSLVYNKDKWMTTVAPYRVVTDNGGTYPAAKDYIEGTGITRPDFYRKDWIPDKPTGEIVDMVFNSWVGISATKWQGVTRNNITWSAFKTHVLAMSGGDEAICELALTYLAHMFLHPLERPNWWWLIYSHLRGVGKSALGVILCKIIGHVHSHFNFVNSTISTDFVGAEFDNRLFVSIGDIAAGNRVETAQVFNNIITNDETVVHRKGIDRYEVPNYLRGIYSLNEPLIQLSRDERRWLVTDVLFPNWITGDTPDDRKLTYAEWFRLNLGAAVNGDREALLDIYNGLVGEYGRAASLFDPKADPPRTETFYELAEETKALNKTEASSITSALFKHWMEGGAVAYNSDRLKLWLLSKGYGAGTVGSMAKEIGHFVKHTLNEGKRVPSAQLTGGERINIVGKNTAVKESPKGDRTLCIASQDDIKLWLAQTELLVPAKAKF